ncbi:MAG: hypothetical protein WBE21_11325 [Candidatus Acidiferrales bacterium]
MTKVMKNRSSRKQNLIIWTTGLIALALVILADHNGLPQKWHTAIFGTVAPFGFVVAIYPRRWGTWSFWAAFAICFAVHLLAMWILFQYVILGVAPGWALWTPIAFVECFVLLVAVRRIENRLLGKHPRTISL